MTVIQIASIRPPRDARLTAKLGGGVRLDLVLADARQSRYDLVVWKAD